MSEQLEMWAQDTGKFDYTIISMTQQYLLPKGEGYADSHEGTTADT